MSTVREELEEELRDTEYRLSEAEETNEWLAKDVNRLVGAVRLNHDLEDGAELSVD